jgi:uncharacterized damage-inducible protein DinB
MKRAQGWTRCLALAALLAVPTFAQEKEMKKAEPAEKKAAAKGPRAEILLHIADAERKLIALAEAVPADKFGWRPAAGVRSVGEVYMHVAAGNYFLCNFFGAAPPAGFDLRGMEKEGGDKAKVVDALKKSFEHVHAAIAAVPDSDLEKPVKLFGHDGTYREAFLLIATHDHEHLGQSIAYARMSGVTPPWSAAAGGGQ